MIDKMNTEDLNAVRSFIYTFRSVERFEQIIAKVLLAAEETTRIEMEGRIAGKDRDKIKAQIEELKAVYEGQVESHKSQVESMKTEREARLREINGALEEARRNIPSVVAKELAEGRRRNEVVLGDLKEKISQLRDEALVAREEMEITGRRLKELQVKKDELEKAVNDLDVIRQRHEDAFASSLAMLRKGG